jgi:ppGpp synthetase/RelA/SpoT-type nucleotidyltranferase
MLDSTYPNPHHILAPASVALSADDALGVGEMEFAVPHYKRERVNIAGARIIRTPDKLLDPDEEWDEYFENLEIVNNWRSAHAYPLLVMRVTLGRYAKKIDQDALVAQRIKRLVSINAKLDREKRMKLSQMQDIGGCRAVVSSIDNLRHLRQLYKESDIKHELASFDDYVDKPRSSGYRGYHLVYKYRSDKAAKKVYNDLKIELQLRSQYQHAWATAVETVGTFIGQALKSSIGPERWLRFFQLMGTAVAMREGTPPVPGTGSDAVTLIEELRYQSANLGVAHTLATFSDAMRTLPRSTPEEQARAYYYLLRLNAKSGELTIDSFARNQSLEASLEYLEAEKEVKLTQGLDAVLVSVDSLSALEKAYPNYFADTRVFVELMNQALSGNESPITAPSLL